MRGWTSSSGRAATSTSRGLAPKRAGQTGPQRAGEAPAHLGRRSSWSARKRSRSRSSVRIWASREALASQRNLAALARPLVASSASRGGSASSSATWWATWSGSVGSTSRADSPAISGSSRGSTRRRGSHKACASTTGSPKPCRRTSGHGGVPVEPRDGRPRRDRPADSARTGLASGRTRALRLGRRPPRADPPTTTTSDAAVGERGRRGRCSCGRRCRPSGRRGSPTSMASPAPDASECSTPLGTTTKRSGLTPRTSLSSWRSS